MPAVMVPDPTELFPGALSADQLSLFGADEDRLQPPIPSFTPDPEAIRRRLHGLLTLARDAKVMPWPERDARMWQTVFPQMANWLPNEEAEQLRFAFIQEFERLKAAA